MSIEDRIEAKNSFKRAVAVLREAESVTLHALDWIKRSIKYAEQGLVQTRKAELDDLEKLAKDSLPILNQRKLKNNG